MVYPQVKLYCTAEVPASDLFRPDTGGNAAISDESRELMDDLDLVCVVHTSNCMLEIVTRIVQEFLLHS